MLRGELSRVANTTLISFQVKVAPHVAHIRPLLLGGGIWAEMCVHLCMPVFFIA